MIAAQSANSSRVVHEEGSYVTARYSYATQRASASSSR